MLVPLCLITRDVERAAVRGGRGEKGVRTGARGRLGARDGSLSVSLGLSLSFSVSAYLFRSL